MFCSNCGQEVKDGEAFCGNCGTPVKKQKSLGLSTSSEGTLNIVGIIASVLVIISAFLPYATVSIFGVTESTSLVKGGDGYIFIGLAIAAIVLAVLKKDIFVAVAGVIMVVVCFIEMADASEVFNDAMYGDYIKKGAGYYLVILSSIVVTVSPFIGTIINKIKNK